VVWARRTLFSGKKKSGDKDFAEREKKNLFSTTTEPQQQLKKKKRTDSFQRTQPIPGKKNRCWRKKDVLSFRTAPKFGKNSEKGSRAKKQNRAVETYSYDCEKEEGTTKKKRKGAEGIKNRRTKKERIPPP